MPKFIKLGIFIYLLLMQNVNSMYKLMFLYEREKYCHQVVQTACILLSFLSAVPKGT